MNRSTYEESNGKALAERFRQQNERYRDHYHDAPDRFLAAWKKAIGMIGPDLFFCDGPEDYRQAIDRNQIRPDPEAIERYMAVCSVGKGVFLGAVCSFYSGDWGLALGRCHGYAALGDIANRLELDQLEVLTELMLSHTGW